MARVCIHQKRWQALQKRETLSSKLSHVYINKIRWQALQVRETVWQAIDTR